MEASTAVPCRRVRDRLSILARTALGSAPRPPIDDPRHNPDIRDRPILENPCTIRDTSLVVRGYTRLPKLALIMSFAKSDIAAGSVSGTKQPPAPVNPTCPWEDLMNLFMPGSSSASNAIGVISVEHVGARFIIPQIHSVSAAW